MYDYKFRQRDLTFGKPRRSPLRKVLLGTIALAVVAVLVYAAMQLDLTADSQQRSEAGSDIIPLALPPHPDSPQGFRADGRPAIPSQTLTERAFAGVMGTIQGVIDTVPAAKAAVQPAPSTKQDSVAEQAFEQIQASITTQSPVTTQNPVSGQAPGGTQDLLAEQAQDAAQEVIPTQALTTDQPSTVEQAPDTTQQLVATQLPTTDQASIAEQTPIAEEATVQDLGEEVATAAQVPEVAETQRQDRWIEYVVQSGDTLTKILQSNGLSPQLVQRIVGSGKQGKRLEKIRPGDTLRIHLDPDQNLSELHLQIDKLKSLQLVVTDEGVTGTLVHKATKAKSTVATGTINHSLFSSAQAAGLPDSVTMKMAAIFGWDIDFALEIRSGDKFSVIYEELWADGEVAAAGNIQAAEFVNQGRSYKAIRYKDSDGKVDYYTAGGKPLKKTFFRTPVKFSRISSGFSKRRWHPILRRSRPHKGVDYAAPTGTPVLATGDGVVDYVGWKRGYGRVINLRHGRTYKTVYGHLSRFAKGLNRGDKVAQGEVIGFVGKTGLATGPHLHYEFHVNGVHRNPLTVKAPIADPMSRKERAKFDKIAKPLLAQLDESANGRLVADAR